VGGGGVRQARAGRGRGDAERQGKALCAAQVRSKARPGRCRAVALLRALLRLTLAVVVHHDLEAQDAPPAAAQHRLLGPDLAAEVIACEGQNVSWHIPQAGKT
jgi:hypothetical protein